VTLAALTGLVESVASLLRQLVHVVGWVVLLVGCVGMALHPHLSLGYLMTPASGVLAVLQGMIRPRRGQGGISAKASQETASRPPAEESRAGQDKSRLAVANNVTASSALAPP
jgi:hypothetical protein